MKFLGFCLAWLATSIAYAHEMTPAYPKLVPSHVQGVKKTSVEVFNRRNDVEFYELGVFAADWSVVPFVSTYRIFKLQYLNRIKLEVYIRDEDAPRAMYLCSVSKLRPDVDRLTAVSSRICSKLK